MRNLKLTYERRGVESCVATLTAEIDGQEMIQTLDFSGNAIGPVLHGAVSIVNALQEMHGDKPMGWLEIKRTRKERKRNAQTSTPQQSQ